MRQGRRAALRNERGSVAVHVGIMMIAIIGMVSVGIEIGYLLLKHREMQSAADSAAMSGATALGLQSPADFRMEARAVASVGGFTDGVDGATVTVNSPPLGGTNAGNPYAVEVIVSQPQTLSLIQVYRSGLFDVGARAVALAQPGFLYCMLALDPSASDAVMVQNNAVVTSPDCGVAVDSSSSNALSLRNNAAINGPVHVHGDWTLSNNARLNGTPNIDHAPVIDDPYAGVALQSAPACTSQSGQAANNVTVTLNPGHFCNGFDFGNDVTVNLNPGAYYIDDQFTLTNNVTLNGMGGVTLIVMDNYALDFGNNARIDLVAPTTGPYAGIAIFGKRDGTANRTHTFSNNTQLNVQGVIYFPNQIVKFLNNGVTGSSRCTQVIARIIEIDNNVRLDNGCAGTGVKPIGGGLSQLIE
jgi:hypothetical protein